MKELAKKAKSKLIVIDDEKKELAEITKSRLKKPDVSIKPAERIIAEMKKPNEKIYLHDVNNLINKINNEIAEDDNIVDLGDSGEIYFRDLINFLYDIKDGKISYSNKKKEYKKRFRNTEKSSRIEQNLVEVQNFMNNILIN